VIGAASGLLLAVVFAGPDFRPVGPTVATTLVVTLTIALTLRLMTPVMLWKL
jgi:hypothetical protein